MCPSRRSVLQMIASTAACHATSAFGDARVDAFLGDTADIADHRVICGLNAFPSFKSTRSVKEAPVEAQKGVALILDAIGIEQNFEVLVGEFSAKVGGFATIRDDQRYIVYDGAEFSFADGRTDWVAMGLLSHEIGHHIAAHVYITQGTSQEDELEADGFAGVALSRLGATLDQALAWTAGLSETGGSTHPPRVDRFAAVTAGWQHGEHQKLQERGTCTPQWRGEPFRIEGRQCRIATTCDQREEHIRVACEAYDRSWEWVGSAKK